LKRHPIVFVLLHVATLAVAAEYRVTNAVQLASAAEKLRPGDVVVMVNGDWMNQSLGFTARGTADKPITLRGETPGKVLLRNGSTLAVDGEYVTVSGLAFGEGESERSAVELRGRNCRLTETSVVAGQYKFFVHVRGTSNRVDHCYLAGKTSVHPTLQVEVEGRPNHHIIDHNYFGPRPPLRRNGGETIRVGYSHQSMTNSGTLVERNLFEQCDGENEIISNKSCENIYRFNTFRDCAGMFTLRHGNRCRVEGNFFFGNGKRGSGGIRVIGEDHVVINNYIERVQEGGFWITSGIVDSPLNGYFPARNCLIAFNTFVDSPGPALDLDAGIGRARRTLLPENITIANNLLCPTDGHVFNGDEGKGFRWPGNLTSASSATNTTKLRIAAPKFARAAGLLRPANDSPARNAAEGTFAAVTIDIDGQPRAARFDVGCDQFSTMPTTNRPLTPADVGPSWMKRPGVLTSTE
jgi:poly(beta-D-mannuronate) lyase